MPKFDFKPNTAQLPIQRWLLIFSLMTAVTVVADPVEKTALIGGPWFERMQLRPALGNESQDDHDAELNFKLELSHDSTGMVLLDQVVITHFKDQAGSEVQFPAMTFDSDRVRLDHIPKERIDDIVYGIGFGHAGIKEGKLVFSSPECSSSIYRDTTDYAGTAGTGSVGDCDQKMLVGFDPKGEPESEDAWHLSIPFGKAEWVTGVGIIRSHNDFVAGGTAKFTSPATGDSTQFALAKIDAAGHLVDSFGSLGDGTHLQGVAGCNLELAGLENWSSANPANPDSPFTGYLVGGTARCPGFENRVVLMRFSEDGVLDQSFGVGGIALHGYGVGLDTIRAIHQSDLDGGSLFVTGSTFSGELFVASFNSSAGEKNLAWNGGTGFQALSHVDSSKLDGYALDQMNPSNDSRLVVVGETLTTDRRWQVLVVRFSEDGTLDTSFDDDGIVTTGFNGFSEARGRGVALSSDSLQQVILSAHIEDSNTSRFGLKMLTWWGDADSTWGVEGGELTMTFTPSDSSPYGLTRSGQRLIVPGQAQKQAAVVQVRAASGAPDIQGLFGRSEAQLLRWPDTGHGNPGETNKFFWGNLPQLSRLELSFLTWPELEPAGTTIIDIHPLLALATEVEYDFPAKQTDLGDDLFWKYTHGHHLGSHHNKAEMYWPQVGWLSNQLYAYDMSIVRWDSETSNFEGKKTPTMKCDGGDPDPGKICSETEPNDNRWTFGQPVRAMADGWIDSCVNGVYDHSGPRKKDGPELCDNAAYTHPDFEVDGSGLNWDADNDGVNESCMNSGGGNMFYIRHADGSHVLYAHLKLGSIQDDPLAPGELLCPINHKGPAPSRYVKRGTLLGRVGNSGSSDGPHLHIHRAVHKIIDGEVYPNGGAPAPDARPLYWRNVRSAHFASSLINPFDPAHYSDYGFGSTPFHNSLLDIVTIGNPPQSEECTQVNPFGQLGDEDKHPDGDFDSDYYCSNENGEAVCLEEDGVGVCELCEGENKSSGCSCQNDEQCGGDSFCWGINSGQQGNVDGKCYPADGPPWWQCELNCEAMYPGFGAYCYNDHPAGYARCVDGLTGQPTAFDCWLEGKGAYDGECIDECTADAPEACQEVWGYPETWTCKSMEGMNVCAP